MCDQLESGDYVLTSTGYLGSWTGVSIIDERWVGKFANDEEAIAAIKADMDRENYWPNVWRIDDHGGLHGPLNIYEEAT